MKLPQLSLRDLFWLVTLVAMGCGWWMERTRLAQEWDKLEKAKNFAEAKHELLLESTKFQLEKLLHERGEWQRIKDRLDYQTRGKVEAAEEQEAFFAE